jgi:hypothetical protein
MRRSILFAATAAALAIAPFIGGGRADAQEIKFSLQERQVIVDFYGVAAPARGNGKTTKNKGRGVGSHGMPPGLAKKGKLPPGIAKRQLPAALVAQMPPPPKGYERVIVDNDVLLVHIATQIVHDVLTDVLH